MSGTRRRLLDWSVRSLRHVAGRSRRLLGTRSVRSALVVLLVVWLAGLLLSQRAETSYQSEAVVAFVPRDPVATGAETMVLVVPKYVEVLRSPDVVDRAAAQLDTTSATVRSSSEAVVQPNTLNLVLQTTSADPETASRLAQVLAAGVIDVATTDPLVRAELVAPAVPGAAPVMPSPVQLRTLALALGVVAAVIAGVGVARRGAGWERLAPLLRPGPTDGGRT